MPVTLYSYRLGREVPLLSEEEYAPIARALAARLQQIQDYRKQHGASLAEARREISTDALDIYERLTGVRLSDPDELHAVELKQYGRPCPRCGKPFRTPQAHFCAECGFTLPEGQRAGPAVVPEE